ncbi:MAG: carboxylesterase family protein [Pseudomonadales bacterium]|nr:carboxylesterase family protein [Pseudomonadales bacterium]
MLRICAVGISVFVLLGCSAGPEEGAASATPPALPEVVGPVVSVTGGNLRGTVREDGLQEFLGIPYAAPPIGTKRWQPPAPLTPWEGELAATEFGLPCYQPGSLSAFYDRTYTQMSEDCLTLNVWTRGETVADDLPVMVWVHGGALVMGSGGDYDGAPLSAEGVVLVTINYRLGPFGFFAHPSLSEEGGGTSGNQGFRDQIAALTWVQNNIVQFGGNPDNVTIFGESAGAWSMSVLQASPLARGLFHKVIGQSGARFIPLSDLREERWGLPSGEAWGQTVAAKFSGSQSPDLEALRDLSAQEIMDAFAADPEILMNFDRLTIVDGEVLPDEVNTIFAAGNQTDVPVLIGSNADEATTFDPALLNPGGSTDYVAAHSELVARTLPAAGDEVLALYPESQEVARDSYIRFNTDAMFTQPMRLWADYTGNTTSPAYLYWWNWRPVINGSDAYGAFHAAEIPYVFGNWSMFGIDVTPEDEAFSATMRKMWTNFAKTGNPSVEGTLAWPAYTQEKPVTAILGAEIGLAEGVRSEEVEVITTAYNAFRD